MSSNEKIIVLLGAGAMIESTKVSTASLTRKIEKCCQNREDCRVLFKLIKEGFKGLYNKDDSNFEDIFNVAELLYGYKTNNHCKGYVPQEMVFSKLKDSFEEIELSTIYALQEIILATINDEIHEYDINLDIYGEWFKNFFARLESETKESLDVYNLNYDTWVEQSLSSYTDGYIEIDDLRYKEKMMRFDAPTYLQENVNRVSHLHGQIYFDYPRFDVEDEESTKIGFKEPADTLYKYKSYEYAKNVRDHVVRSGDKSQTGNYIYKANIITGMMKLDKILWHPFDMYLGEFINSLKKNNKLIIIGYGFFDLYVNRLLEMFNSVHLDDRKIVLVDYVPESDLHCLIEHPFTSLGNKAEFSNLIFQDDYWWEKRRYKLKDISLVKSDDGNGLVCLKGFYDASQKIDEILDFLRD